MQATHTAATKNIVCHYCGVELKVGVEGNISKDGIVTVQGHEQGRVQLG